MPASSDPTFGINYGWDLDEDGWKAGMDFNLQLMAALLKLTVVSRSVGTPPGSPVAFDTYIVPATGTTGAWVGKENQLAVRFNGTWNYFPAWEGAEFWVADVNQKWRYDGSAWVSVAAGAGDVVGPASSVDNELALFSGTTGKLLKRGPALSSVWTTTNLVKTASATDATEGSVPVIRSNGGIFGLGGLIQDITDSNTASGTRFFRPTAADPNGLAPSSGYTIHMERVSGAQTAQIEITDSSKFGFRYRNSAGIWQPWREAYTTGNTSIDVQTLLGAANKQAMSDAVTTTGTFTPVVIGSTSAGAGTYSTQSGVYSRCGNVVTVIINLAWTAHTGTGDLQIAGLPFTSAGGRFYICAPYQSSLLVGAGRELRGQLGGSSTTIALRAPDPSGAPSVAVAMDTDVTALRLELTYFV